MQKTHSSRPARACDPTLDMAITGLMAALVFTGTYFFKIPTAFGYTHLGDCMIILTVCLFGTRRGMLAGAIGAGLSDFIAGYAAWVLPTIVLKGGWALIMGLIMYRLLPHFKYSWLAGAVTGGIFHVIGYTLVKIPLYGGGVAMAECFTLIAQTAAAISTIASIHCKIRLHAVQCAVIALSGNTPNSGSNHFLMSPLPACPLITL